MYREPFLLTLLSREHFVFDSTAQEHRFQAEQMHHGAAIDIVEIVRSLVERFVVVWRAMIVNQEYPPKTLFSELVGQIHVDCAQRRHTNRIASRKYPLASNRVGGVVAQRNL